MHLDPRLLALTRGVRLRIALAALLGLAAVPVALWRLTLTGQTLAQVFQGASLASLAGVLGLIASLVVTRALLQFARDEVANGTAARVHVWLQRLLYQHALRLGPGHFDQRRTGDTVLALVDSVERLDVFFGPYLPQLAVAVLTPLVVFVALAALDVQTALIYLVFALLTLVAPALFHRANRASGAARSRSYAALGSDLLDSIQGLGTLRAFGQSRQRGALLAQRARDLYRTTMSVTAANMGTQGVTMLGVTAGAATALAWGAIRVHEGSLPLSTLLVVLLLGVEVFRPLRDLVGLYHAGMLATASAHRIYELLDAQPTVVDPPHAVSGAALPPTVRFEGVRFAYDPRRRLALDDVSFELRAGETLGVVGASGAGKSTLVNLLLRFVDPQAGRVLVGGQDVRSLPQDLVRRQVALVAQDTYLFHGSVADNLRLGKPDATQAELEAAARLANIHDFVASLPHGYQTMVGERGARLSGGQRQRVAIARALLKDAPILVLDEALSSVDAENEATIQAALERLQRGRTTLVIAHRLSSVASADRILVLEQGRVVETGRHAELLARGGVYARLMAAQHHVEDPSSAVTLDEALLEPEAPAATPAAESGQGTAGPAASSRYVGAFELWGRLLRLVVPWWWEPPLMLAIGLLHAVSTVALGVVGALLVGRVARGEDPLPLVWALVALVPFTGVFQWLDIWVPHDLAFKLLAEMRIKLYRTLDPLAPAFLQRRRSGDLVSTATGDVELIEMFYAHTMVPLLVALLVPTGALLVLAWIGWQLAVALLPFVVAVALTPLLANGTMERLGVALRHHTGDMNAHVVDAIQGLRAIVAFGQGPAFASLLEARARELTQLKRRFQRWQSVQAAAIEALIGLGALAVLAVGAGLVAQGQLERTLLPVATLLAMSAFQPVVAIVIVAKELLQTVAAARRYFALEDEPVPVRDGPGVALPSGPRGVPIDLEHVTFAYGPGDRPALRDVSLHVEAGQTVALVGRSGAGKTTLAHLLLRFWDPQEGRILAGGQDVRAFLLDDLRRLVSLVAQDTYLFNTTLRENLRLGRPDATDAEVLDAARRANVDEFAEALPDGYETVVGERGLQLSGGQRQRIAIARALLKDAPILILDEATSHLDAVNEAQVREAMTYLVAGRTTLVIAHRLSTVRDADRIVVLDQGEVVEQGTHAELLALDGLYSHLIASQLSGRWRERLAPSPAEPVAGGLSSHGHAH